MITKFMTEVSTKFNPFSACAKPARLFLSNLPPNARSTGVKISSSLLARNSPEPSSLYVKFSKSIDSGKGQDVAMRNRPKLILILSNRGRQGDELPMRQIHHYGRCRPMRSTL